MTSCLRRPLLRVGQDYKRNLLSMKTLDNGSIPKASRNGTPTPGRVCQSKDTRRRGNACFGQTADQLLVLIN